MSPLKVARELVEEAHRTGQLLAQAEGFYPWRGMLWCPNTAWRRKEGGHLGESDDLCMVPDLLDGQTVGCLLLVLLNTPGCDAVRFEGDYLFVSWDAAVEGQTYREGGLPGCQLARALIDRWQTLPEHTPDTV